MALRTVIADLLSEFQPVKKWNDHRAERCADCEGDNDRQNCLIYHAEPHIFLLHLILPM
jgi:hypothetical protein